MDYVGRYKKKVGKFEMYANFDITLLFLAPNFRHPLQGLTPENYILFKLMLCGAELSGIFFTLNTPQNFDPSLWKTILITHFSKSNFNRQGKKCTQSTMTS